MKSLQLVLASMATLASVNAAGASHGASVLGEEFDTQNQHPTFQWNYSGNGNTWGVKTGEAAGITPGSGAVNMCGKGKTVPQSPIDLKNSWPKKSNILDRFSKVYTDQTTKINVAWNGHATQVPVDKDGQDIQSFYSNLADVSYKSPKRFNGVQFHFHAQSEHTVEGKRHDLEMHTVHLPYDGEKVVPAINGFMASAMGLMFSVDDYDKSVEDWQVKIIDNFFDQLKLDDITDTKSTPLNVEKVSYGALMMMVNMQDRWTYRGSVTTPPCATAVYWNVLRTVYPIKAAHLAGFKKQLARSPGLAKQGNWREIQPYVEGDKGTQAQIITSDMGGNVGMLIAVIILAILTFVLLMVVMKLRSQIKNGEVSTAVQPIANGDSLEMK